MDQTGAPPDTGGPARPPAAAPEPLADAAITSSDHAGPEPAAPSPLAVALTGPGAVVTAWTPGAERLLGYRPQEMIGRSALDLLAGPPPAGRSAIAAGEWRGLVALRHRDGTLVEADVHASRIRDPQGTAVWLLAAAPGGEPDELRELAFAQLPAPLAVYDRAGRLVAANDAVLGVLALEQDAVLGLPLAPSAVTPTGPPYDRIERLLADALRTGEPLRDQTRLPNPDQGGTRTWETLVYPLKDPQGRVRGAAIGARDSTAEYRARQRLAVVNLAGVRIGTTLDVTRTAQELADLAIESFFCDFAAVDLLEGVVQGADPELGPPDAPAAYRRAAQQSVLANCPESVVAPGSGGRYAAGSPMARALAVGRPSLHRTDDPALRRWLAADPVRAESIRSFGIHSMIVAPLVARGATLGVVLLLRHRTSEPFDAGDLLLAEDLAVRAAVGIDNARRYTYERQTALTLQRTLLPQRMPRQAAVDIASRYLPAGSRAGVGGDWFDVIPLSGARVALVVGDVVGHGIQASATMGRLRTAVRTLADVDMPPDELLTHLDDLVLRLDRETGPRLGDLDGREAGDVGATCLYAVYDPIARRCTLARAGHPGPAVVHPDHTVEFPLLPTGPPLGVGGLPFESAELDLPEGSLLALFTDGLIGAADHDIDLGLTRLGAALAAGTGTLEQTCDQILAALLPVAPADDVALLLARTRGLADDLVATWDVPPDPVEVGHMRKLATEQLSLWGLEELSFVTELVVSELVTNAIRYGRPPIQLRLIRDTGLICEVSDASSTSPHLRRARSYDEGGRGLMLVAQLTQGWGARHSPDGKTIWAEQTLPPARD